MMIAKSMRSSLDQHINVVHYQKIMRIISQLNGYQIKRVFVLSRIVEENSLANHFKWQHWVIKANSDEVLLTLQIYAPNENGDGAFAFEIEPTSEANKDEFFFYKRVTTGRKQMYDFVVSFDLKKKTSI